jgi:hypothetical protein
MTEKLLNQIGLTFEDLNLIKHEEGMEFSSDSEMSLFMDPLHEAAIARDEEELNSMERKSRKSKRRTEKYNNLGFGGADVVDVGI